jgi:hypothetical protein
MASLKSFFEEGHVRRMHKIPPKPDSRVDFFWYPKSDDRKRDLNNLFVLVADAITPSHTYCSLRVVPTYSIYLKRGRSISQCTDLYLDVKQS